MPYVSQSKKRRDGGAHARFRFQYAGFRGIRRTAVGTTSKTDKEKLALQVQAEPDAFVLG